MSKYKPITPVTIRVPVDVYLDITNNDLSKLVEVYHLSNKEPYIFKALINNKEALVQTGEHKHAIFPPNTLWADVEVVYYDYIKKHAIFKEEKELFKDI